MTTSYEKIYSAATAHLDPSSLSKSNKTAKIILKDLADIKKMKKQGAKKNQKIEKLIFFIVQTLRRLDPDHLIETTSIWVLINLIEISAAFARKAMMAAGIPGVLYGILNSHSLAGATRKYASDLCMYLAQGEETHEKLEVTVGMMDSLAESSLEQPSMSSNENEFQGMPGFLGNRGSMSYVESLLSSHSTVTRNSAPFVPYVVNDENAEALNRIFDDRGAVNVSREQVFMETVASQLPGPTGLDNLAPEQRDQLSSPARGTRGGIDDQDNESFIDQSIGSADTGMESAFGKNSMFSSRPKIEDLGAGYNSGAQRPMKGSTLFKLQNPSLRDNRNRESAKELHRENQKFQSPGGFGQFQMGDINSMRDDNTIPSQVSYLDHDIKAASAVHRDHQDDVYGLNSPDSEFKGNMSPLGMKGPGSAFKSPVTNNILPMTTATDFLFSLDPLGQEEGFNKLPAPKLVSEVNDDEESLLSISMSEMDEDEDEEEEEAQPNEESSPKRTAKKLRIRAEKLLDQRFIQGLFAKKMGMKATQTFLKKLQDLLELVDTEKTGYVPWGSFGRVLVNIAPAHMLRKDVETFLDAQVEHDEDLINYGEFIISGKITIVEKKHGRSVLPINGWLERQKLYSGDASTWTWKNHLKWYNERQREAVVWLMRRSTRAQVQEVVLGKAKDFLYNEGKRAKAVSFLLHCGYKAKNALASRKESKRRLMLRAYKARMLRNRVSDAYQYLSVLAGKVKFMEEVAASKGKKIKIEDVLTDHAPQRGYEILYETRNKHIMAKEGLLKRAKHALKHSANQDAAQAQLALEAKRVLTQLVLVERARQWLFEKAAFYHAYCCEQDNTLLYLKRKGKWALAYFDRQAAALPWLMQRGRDALAHNKLQEDTMTGLIKTGRFKLNLLNNREHAIAYCKTRRYNAEALIENQKEAIKYLRGKVALLEGNIQLVKDQEQWLYDRGQSAIVHVDLQRKAVRRLQYQGGRARVVHRKLVNAFIDLHQTGQQARIANFNKLWPGLGGQGANMSRLNDEIVRIRKKNREVRHARDADETLKGADNKEARWKVELQDAFTLLTKNVFMPGETVNDKKNVLDIEREPKISRINFLRLMKDGHLLRMTKDQTNKAWKEMDPQAVGFLGFQDVWDWFEIHAFERHREVFLKSKGKKYFTFTMPNIVSVHEQALFVFKARFAVQERRMVSGEESSDEEEDSESDSDDDDSEPEEEEEAPTELSDFDKAFEKLIDQHKPAMLRSYAEDGDGKEEDGGEGEEG